MRRLNFILLVSLLLNISCKKLTAPLSPKSPVDDSILDGPIDGLTPTQRRQFLDGDAAFNKEVFNSSSGLGPYFVATSCGTCHAGDGKGHPFTTLTRFGQSDSTGNKFLGYGGPQLQNRALPGYEPEQIPAGASHAKFTPLANTGLGFLAALSDEQLLSNSDPNDINGDGISGVPNYVNPPHYFIPQWFHIPKNGKYIARFGRKAGAVDLLNQTVNAYNQDMGITSEFAMSEPAVNGATNQSPDNVPDPEIASSTVQNVVFYLRSLKAPIQRNPGNGEVVSGKQLFINSNCSSCHVPEWTAPNSDLSALSNQTFAPYTDLLLHDMGSGLDDGYTEGSAKTSEWRTAPLWGIGLSEKSQGGGYYLLHDGRARSIEEAILLHGGEAENSKNIFSSLSQGEKQLIIKFLESL